MVTIAMCFITPACIPPVVIHAPETPSYPYYSLILFFLSGAPKFLKLNDISEKLL